MDSSKNNICFFNSCRTWGGGEKWHFEAAKFLKSKGYTVTVAASKGGELYNKALTEKLNVFPIDVRNLSFLNPFSLVRTYFFLKKNKINKIVLGLPSDAKLGGITSKFASVSKIVYRRGSANPVKNTWLNRFLFKNILTDVIVNSLEIKRMVLYKNKNLINDEHIFVLYNGVNLSQYKVEEKDKGTTIVLGTAGRIVDQKAQHYIIKAAQILKNQSVDFKLRIAGKGPLKSSLVKLTQDLDVSDRVIFDDFVTDINGFLNEIDIFILSSIHEGCANILVEALACGTPVVAFNNSSIPEIITHNKNGLLAEFGNINDLAEKIKTLIEDAQLRQSFAIAARAEAESRFDANDAFNKLESFLQQ